MKNYLFGAILLLNMSCGENEPSAIQKDAYYLDTIEQGDSIETEHEIVLPEDNTNVIDTNK